MTLVNNVFNTKITIKKILLMFVSVIKKNIITSHLKHKTMTASVVMVDFLLEQHNPNLARRNNGMLA
jgi:hypothetical protein